MSNARTVNAAWSQDGAHLLFTFNDSNPETDYFYYIPKAELLNENGRKHWLWHLSEKNWFTATLKAKIESMIMEASE